MRTMRPAQQTFFENISAFITVYRINNRNFVGGFGRETDSDDQKTLSQENTSEGKSFLDRLRKFMRLFTILWIKSPILDLFIFMYVKVQIDHKLIRIQYDKIRHEIIYHWSRIIGINTVILILLISFAILISFSLFIKRNIESANLSNKTRRSHVIIVKEQKTDRSK